MQSHAVNVGEAKGLSEVIFSKYFVWNELKRSVAWLLRYKHWLLSKMKGNEAASKSVRQGRITAEEIRQAEHVIISNVQREQYEQDISKLKHLRRLDPVYKEGLLCVGGRLKHMPDRFDDLKNPAILPKSHHVVNLIIRHYHLQSGHFGVEYVLSQIREKYWIIKARVAVRRVINSCFDCKQRLQQPAQQKMADLPPDRVIVDKPPFTNVGVDCFGPFVVKRGRTLIKRYGVPFTFLAVRAIHIEVAQNLEADSFINALRRFIARRGKPDEIRSNNGTNFTGSNRELNKAMCQWNQSNKVHSFLLQREMKWLFNPPAASHMGGVWERAIRSVRKVLNALLKEQTLDDEGLQTLLCEAESIINGRPLTKVSDDPRDYHALTPNHLLLLRPNQCLPPGLFNKNDQYSSRRWRQVQYLADIFWKRWTREYIPLLQTRQKWHDIKRNFKIGDVVLVVEQTMPRGCWPLGRITEVTPGRDGLVRSLKVKTMKSELVRPIDKICLLEAAEPREEM